MKHPVAFFLKRSLYKRGLGLSDDGYLAFSDEETARKFFEIEDSKINYNVSYDRWQQRDEYHRYTVIGWVNVRQDVVDLLAEIPNQPKFFRFSEEAK